MPSSSSFDVLWLSASPSLKRFDLPLLRHLAQHSTVAHWEYVQTADEASSLDKAVVLLHDFLKFRDRPVHLAGHGLGGVLALSYARRYRSRVQSLSLLAVAAQPATTWQAHYYVQRKLLSCSQTVVLANAVRSLFGSELPYAARDLVAALARDLHEAPCLHSLWQLATLPRGGVAMPLLVCGSQTDAIVDPTALREWQPWLKPDDQLWSCPTGRHFFHFYEPAAVALQMVQFWQAIDRRSLQQAQLEQVVRGAPG